MGYCQQDRFSDLNSRFKVTIVVIALIFLQFLSASTTLGEEEIVDVRTGRLSLRTTDLEVQAGPVLLTVQRSLVIGNANPGPLGRRWQLNWEIEMLRSDSIIAIVNAGNLITFNQTVSTGDLVSPSGERLIIKEDGNAILETPDGGSALFDGQGRLVETRDTNGNQTIMAYGPDGYLSRINGPGDVYLSFTHDENGKVVLIEASNGLSVNYRYKDENLSECQVNQEAPTKYEYDEKGNLIRIDRYASDRVRLTYDEMGRVKSRSWVDGSQESFEYDDETRTVRHVDVRGGITIIQRDSDGRKVVTTDPMGHRTTIEYDEKGQPIVVTGPTGVTTVYAYDDLGRLLKIKEGNGKLTRFKYEGQSSRYKSITEGDGANQYDFSYDNRHNLLKITRNKQVIHSFSYHANGLVKSSWGQDTREYTYAYDSRGLVRTQTDALGHITTYEYDKTGNLIGEIDPSGAKTTWVYNDQNRLVSETNALGHTTRYTYDAAGRLAQLIDPMGYTIQHRYDQRGRLISETDQTGHTTEYKYDAAGNLIRMTDPSGNSFGYEYDLNNNPIREINPKGDITTITVDSLRNVTKQTDAYGAMQQYHYTNSGLLAKRVDPLNRETVYAYDTQGNLIKITDPAGRAIKYAYDKMGRLIKVIHPDGKVDVAEFNQSGHLIKQSDNWGASVEYQYDTLGRIIKSRSIPGTEKSYHYDALDRVICSEDTLGWRVHYGYTVLGQLVTYRDATGASIRYHYDWNGRLIDQIDSLGHKKSYSYTPSGDIASVMNPLGDVTRYVYDANGTPKEIHHPAGGITKLDYDCFGNVIAESNPVGAKVRRVFDKLGRLVQVTDAKGQDTRFHYDFDSQLIEKHLADGKVVRYMYDSDGNTVRIDDGSFPIHYQYNNQGLLTRIDYPLIKRKLIYHYDKKGRLKAFIDSEGREMHYQYNPKGQLSSIRMGRGKIFTFEYDLKGRLAKLTYPNHIEGDWSYDIVDRPIQIIYKNSSGKVLGQWDYTYNVAGRLESIKDQKGEETRYKYDKNGQLIEESGPSGTIRYRYQVGGNRESRSSGTQTIRYSYNEADQLLSSETEYYRYDANGNLVEKRGPNETIRFSYDTENQLVKVSKTDGTWVTFGYSPTGERIWRKDAQGKVYFVTDGTNLLAELNADLKPEATYIHSPDVDRPLMMQRGDGQYYYHPKILRTIAFLTASDGKIANQISTDAFGKPLAVKGEIANPFLLGAREYDFDLGLYYFRARYYDPKIGRFISPDPEPGQLLNPETFNRYAYAFNAPTHYIDPSGMKGIIDYEYWGTAHKLNRQFIVQLVNFRHNVMGESHVAAQKAVQDILIRSAKYSPNKIKAAAIQTNLGDLRVKYPAKFIKYHGKVTEHNPMPNFEHVPNAGQTQSVKNPRVIRPGTQTNKSPSVRGPAKTEHIIPGGGRRGPSTELINPSDSGSGRSPGGGSAGGAVPSDASQSSSSSSVVKSRSSGSSSSSASQPSSSSHVSVRHRPGTSPKPKFKPNPGPDAKNWNGLPKKTPPSSPVNTLQSTWQNQIAPATLVVLLSAEIIIRCKNEGLSAGQCAQRLLTAAATAGGVYLAVAGGIVSANVVIVVGGVAMTIKCFYDMITYLYEGGRAWNAKWRAERIEKQRKHWTETNLVMRLKVDLAEMRKKINETMEDPVKNHVLACNELNNLIDTARKGAEKAANLMMDTIPASGKNGKTDAAAQSIKKWKDRANKCNRAVQIKTRMKKISNNVQRWTKKIEGGLKQAENLATKCRSKQEAEKVRKGIKMCQRTAIGIQQQAAEAEKLDKELIKIILFAQDTRKRLSASLEARDKIFSLADKLPNENVIDLKIKEARTAEALVMSTGNELIKQINRLQKAYPDDMDDLKEFKTFFQLKKQVHSLQAKGKCNPNTAKGLFNEYAGKLVNTKLKVETRLSQAMGLDIELAKCPERHSVEDFMEIEKSNNQVKKMLEDMNAILWLAEKCERAIDKYKADTRVEIKSINPLIPNMVDLNLKTIDDKIFEDDAPNPMRIKAGQIKKINLEYVVFGPLGEQLRIDIDPRIIIKTRFKGKPGEPFPSIPLKAITKTVRFGKNETQKVERAILNLSIPYPTEDTNFHDLILDIRVRGEKTKSIVINKAFEVQGPGTDFDGTGDIGFSVWVLEKDQNDYIRLCGGSYPGKIKVSLHPMSGQTAPAPKILRNHFAGQVLENIPLGKYKLVVEALETKMGDFIYKGAMNGTEVLTLFKWNPKNRYAGSWGTSIELGVFKNEKRPSFAKPKDDKKPKNPKEWFIHVKVVDKQDKGITRAMVFTQDGAMAAKEQDGGKYLLGPIKNIKDVSDKIITVEADISFRTPSFSPLGNRKHSIVTLKDKQHVYVTFKFPISLDAGAGGLGAIGGGSDQKPSWVPKPPDGSKGDNNNGGGGGDTAKIDSGGAYTDEGKNGSNGNGGSGSNGGDGSKKTRTRDECERKHCKECYFGGIRISRDGLPVGGRDPCKECLSKKAGVIKRCMQGD